MKTLAILVFALVSINANDIITDRDNVSRYNLSPKIIVDMYPDIPNMPKTRNRKEVFRSTALKTVDDKGRTIIIPHPGK